MPENAVELTWREDSAVLDTLAWALFATGSLEEAMQTERAAISLLEQAGEANTPAAREMRKALGSPRAARAVVVPDFHWGSGAGSQA